MMSAPYYLNAKSTVLGAGPDDSLEPSEAPVDAATRSISPTSWPSVNTARGPMGPPDAPAGPRPTDPAVRGSPPFSWPRYLGIPTLDFDPDIALWPQVPLSRWPFTGPPTAGIWPLGWVGVDNTATVWVCTVGGQPGSWLPLGPGDTLGIVTPQAFGAVGDGVADDTAAVLAAIAAAGTTGTAGHGGVLYFPPGTYACSAQLTYYPSTAWIGAGVNQSQIKLTTDLWNGSAPTAARFITPTASGFTAGNTFRLENLRIIGPGPGALPGQTPSHTNGFTTSPWVVANNVFIGGGFFAGLEIVSNHEKCHNVTSTGNYFNLQYSDASTTNANQAYFSCILTGCGLACIHVSGKNFIEGTNFDQLHLGFGPVGILMTDQQNGWDGSGNPVYTGGTASTNYRIIATSFRDVSFEQVGNIAILDMSTGASNYSLGFGTVVQGDGLISWNNATYGTPNAPINSPDYQATWAIVLRFNSTSSRIETGLYPFTAPPTTGLGVVKTTVVNAALPTFIFNRGNTVQPAANFHGSGTSFGSSAGGRTIHKFVDMIGGGAGGVQGDGISMVATTVISVGDCVELSANGTVQRASGTKPVFGVARTPSPGGTTAMLVVQLNGFGVVNSTVASAGGVAIGSPLYLDAGTTYMVNNTNTAGKVVGQSWSTVGTNQFNAQFQFKVA